MPVHSPSLFPFRNDAGRAERPVGYRILAALVMLLACTSLLAGCGKQTVGHLARAQLQPDTPQAISMQYLRFTYRVVPLRESVGVRGQASLAPGALPAWATWYEQLTVMVYLSDASGRVLDTEEYDYLPRAVGDEGSLPFETRFYLAPDDQGPLYVSFGYRMVATEHAPNPDGTDDGGRSLIVGEGALDN
ncbi:hypothetical protein [Nitratidesulfovibrio sp. SRB-5]|uniref:hypothetical protein n=1 Tax=Nitratidesulfovibrio sp. SRB-5 TaxID=2872636 RepID=UPI001026C70A|nr:hypothetical protein [Nitratidesulfovibrio sp. SRB-5]MBZ2173583.1 hypothetical protein [Nitratidesulfovibrio sp. SRB-5]RXF78277.1 hypothetical protein EKK70_02155 [Desulfovibrio sp. DS-1]